MLPHGLRTETSGTLLQMSNLLSLPRGSTTDTRSLKRSQLPHFFYSSRRNKTKTVDRSIRPFILGGYSYFPSPSRPNTVPAPRLSDPGSCRVWVPRLSRVPFHGAPESRPFPLPPTDLWDTGRMSQATVDRDVLLPRSRTGPRVHQSPYNLLPYLNPVDRPDFDHRTPVKVRFNVVMLTYSKSTPFIEQERFRKS